MTTYTKQRVTLFLDSNLIKHAKTQAIIEDISLTALIAKILIQYLSKKHQPRRSEK